MGCHNRQYGGSTNAENKQQYSHKPDILFREPSHELPETLSDRVQVFAVVV